MRTKHCVPIRRCTDLKHLFERVKSHDNSTTHINNAIAYKTLGKVNIMSQLDDSYRNSVKKHNEEVDKK